MPKGIAKNTAEYSLKEFRTLFPYIYRYRYRYALGLFFNFMVDASQMIMPQFIRRAVDIISYGAFELKQVLVPALSMVALMAVVSLGRFLWRYFIHGSSRRIEAELRENLFSHLISLSYDFYQKSKIGDLMARAINDLNSVRESIGMGFIALMDGIFMTVTIVIIIFIQDAQTAYWAIIPLPLITILILIFGRLIGKLFRRTHDAYSNLSDAVQETFAGAGVIKSFVKEWWFTKKFSDANDHYRDANMSLVRLFGIFFPFISFLSGITVLIVLLIGGIRVTRGEMSPGTMVALFRYLQMLIWPLMGAGFVVNMIQRGAVSLGRINEIMRIKPLIRSPEKPGESDRAPEVPLIELRNLTFEFIPGKAALEDINLSIKGGSVIGILGRTGSGKSTLIKAITRMVDTPGGTVFIKGLESAYWDLKELRKLFAVTPQDSYLFSDSIKNNIAYSLDIEDGNKNWSFTEGKLKNINELCDTPCPLWLKSEDILARAAAMAALEKDFPVFKDGWNTLIGERGLTLSGGQKQRTALARSIAACLSEGREVLILDDSLSAVDSETEKNILDGLFKFLRGNMRHPLTVIIVSHRVSALNRSDEVIVMEKGRIMEQGRPAELIALGGYYARTAKLQSLDAPAEHGPFETGNMERDNG